MKRVKFYSLTIGALTLLLALIMTLSICLTHGSVRANAEDYRPSAIFSAGTGGTVTVTDDGESDTTYVKLTLDPKGQVHFRRDLALKWYTAMDNADYKNAGQARFFSMEFKFLDLNFTEFTLAFESAEENVSKDAKATNTIHFYRQDGKILAALQDSSEQKDDWAASEEEKKDIAYSDRVIVRLDDKADGEECVEGEYALYINDVCLGKMTNVGGTYIEYLSAASSTPRIPFTFTAKELEAGAESLRIITYELNGQSLAVNGAGRIDDTVSPALVIDEKIHAYTLGKRWNLTYKTIDVCDESVTISRKYAMLKSNGGGSFEEPSDSDYKVLSTSSYFMPTSDDQEVDQLVSIYFILDDGTFVESPGENQKKSEPIYLTWYAADSALTHLGDGSEASDYIKVNRSEGGPVYVGLTAGEGENVLEKEEDGTPVLEKLSEEYQEAVTKAAEGLSAGSGAYFYLPSLRDLITSEYTDYRNLSFTVYYRKQGDEAGSSATATSTLKYNGLRFEITKEGKYIFKVMASDGSGQNMKYYYENRLQDVTASNIWDIDEIPQFYFEASYGGATIEKPEDISSGYSGQSYTFTDFTVVALEGFEKKYTLYRFDRDEVPDQSAIPTRATFSSNAELYFNQYKQYMVEIKKFNSNISESDEERWSKTDNDYHWDPDSALSFTPQEATYYILKLDVTESRLPGAPKTDYQVIEVNNKIDKLPEVADWLQNNLVTVILFSISGVLLIILIIVALTKPSEKTVEEIDLESLKGKKQPKDKDEDKKE